jgi:aminopeptidase N
MSKKVKRLYEGFRPENYQLELNPDRDTLHLEGTVVITGQKTGRPSQRLTFHQHGLTITEAIITKNDKKGASNITPSRISHHKSFDEVRLHTDEQLYAGRYTVTLRFKGKVQDGMHGIYVSDYQMGDEKRLMVSTQLESHHAREAFPCIDEPEAKATFDLTLLSPKDEAVIGNTPIKSQSEKDGKLVTTFETTPKMSSYLLAFIFGDLQCKETTTDSGIAVRVWATKAQPADSLDFALGAAKGGIEFFENYYGVPYPLAKCDHVAIPDFSSGAMENWGLITYRERCLLADPATTSQSGREIIALVVCHELSHMWFGDLVTMRWWDDLWLNESFANVMEYLGTDALFSEWEVWNTFITQEGLSALRRDSIAGVQPIKTEVRHPDEISTLFDPSIVYAKGGRLIRMLMLYVGNDDFRKGLKAYFTKHAYSNTVGDDLWQALSAASGKDISAFMNPWLNQSGFPVVTVDQQGKKLSVAQSHFLLDPSKKDTSRTWTVPLLSNNQSVPALLETPDLQVALSADEYIRINQGAVGHYVVHYTNPAHLKAIAAQISTKQLGVAERLMLLSDSSMLARSGMDTFAATLELLEHYTDEDHEPVWDIMALVIGDCRRFIDNSPELEAPLKALLRALIQTQFDRLGWEEKAEEPSQDVKLRASIIGLGVYAEHEAIAARALELFEAYKTDQQVVASELRGIVFGAAIRNTVEGAFEYLLTLDETTQNADLKQDIMGALTLTKETARIDTLLQRLKNREQVRPQDVDHWLVYLLRNRYARRMAWDWLRDNWGWIEDTFREDKSYDYFPRYAASAFNTNELLEEYRAFFEPLKDQTMLTRNITIGIEELETRVAWLERDRNAVEAYFRKSAA